MSIHFLHVGHNAPVKLPQQMRPATLPGPDGEDLIPFVRFLKPSELVVMDADERGCADLKWADALDLDKWLA